jgi:hypothetical protein
MLSLLNIVIVQSKASPDLYYPYHDNQKEQSITKNKT